MPLQFMRQFEPKSHKTCNFEVAAFIASYLLLAGGKHASSTQLNTLRGAIQKASSYYNGKLKGEWNKDTTTHYALNVDKLMNKKLNTKWDDRKDYMHAEYPIDCMDLSGKKIKKGSEDFQVLKSTVGVDDNIDFQIRQITI